MGRLADFRRSTCFIHNAKEIQTIMENKEKFLKELEDFFNRPITEDLNLREDLLATSAVYMMLVAILGDYGINTNYGQLRECPTVGDVLKLFQ